MYLKVCAALILLSPFAYASSVDLKTQLLSCQQITGEEQRLSCFDQIVSRLDATPVIAESAPEPINRVVETPVATATQTPALQQQLAEKFGLKKPKPEEVIEEIASKVSAVGVDLNKKMLVTLENGQQWRQIDREYLHIQPGDSCIVKRGAIGSFLLGIEGSKKRIRVRRVE